jgi:hypothetical protein
MGKPGGVHRWRGDLLSHWVHCLIAGEDGPGFYDGSVLGHACVSWQGGATPPYRRWMRGGWVRGNSLVDEIGPGYGADEAGSAKRVLRMGRSGR